MDLAPPRGGTGSTHPRRTSSQEPHPPAPHQRRHIRYASPESATPPPPPHAILDNLRHQSAISRRAQAVMDASPPPQPPPGPAIASSSQLPEPPGIRDYNDERDPHGQDHDRMETDEGSDESGSDSGAETPEPEGHPRAEVDTALQAQAASGNEAMDTATDDAVAGDSAIATPIPQINQANMGTVRLGVNATTGSLEAVLPSQPFQVVDASGNTMNSEQIQVAIQNAAMENAAVREELAEARRQQQRQTERGQGQDEGGGEDESDDSADEEEHPYWSSFKEDTSSPDEAELAVIEDQMEETSALDHEHWEKFIFEPLTDPDYVPGESARISWTVKGVHGTPESPNREKILRSPSICVGGLYWNIKYFPRGNDGTEQLSVYLECSPTPHEMMKSEKLEAENEGMNDNADVAFTVNGESSVDDSTNNGVMGTAQNANENEESIRNQPEEPVKSSQTLPHEAAEKEAPWRIAAQVGCVIYNPDEPRVYASQKSCHRYCNDNPDWGWTRFHGPWDELHKRKRYQRQALLRNDTLAFTAYIRLINDDTNSLWWHPPKDKTQWNSLEMTGMRAFDCQEYGSSAMVAAMSTWLHLGLIIENVKRHPIPDEIWEPESRMRPALEELQDILNEKNDHSSLESDLRLAPLGAILGFYGMRVNSKMDVIMLWENIRRILSFEAAGPSINSVEEANNRENDLFDEVLVLKQPEPVDQKSATVNSNCPEPQSVQDALNMPPQNYRVWESFPGQHQSPKVNPSILQLELHRQSYNKETRKWKKLTHQVVIDESVHFRGYQYILYGIVVHAGDLESREYYSVIRPGGPETQWFKFAGDNSPKGVTILTSNQALKAHEGGDNVPAGNAAVAYVVSYVRMDKVPAVLSATSGRKNLIASNAANVAANTANVPPYSALDTDFAPVYFYGAETFKDFSGRGIFDPWSQEVQRKPDAVTQLKLPLSATVRQVRDLLQLEALKDHDEAQVGVWVIKTTAPAVRAYPGLLPFKDRAGDILGSLNGMGGCRLWLDVRNCNGMKPIMQRLQALTDTELLQLLNAKSASGLAADSEPSQQGDSNAIDGGIGDTVMVDTQDAIPETDRSVFNDSPNRSSPILDAAHEQANDQAPAHPDGLAQAQNATRDHNPDTNEASTGTDPSSSEVLYFIKIFDADAQSLRGVGTYIANCGTKITQQARTSLNIETNEAWDFYHEHSLTLKPRDLIKPSSTFLDLCYGETAFDGTVIVAQRRPSAIQVNTLEQEGKCANPIDYFAYLKCHYDPAYARSHRASSYFARGYESVDLAYGRAHGHGTSINLVGDHYTGNFTAGLKVGAGTMDYANGDTYEGEWKGDEPNGQGKMVYAKTGNVYTGGFKKRKRHGQGMFVLKVADEDMQLCKICYENEMNACFNSCGHVVACDECARQVDVCPVCRAAVRSVVRMWGVKVVEDLGGG